MNRHEALEAIWNVLVEECGAPSDGMIAGSFFYHFDGSEFRFQGSLGFGGKVYADKYHTPCAFVTCYQEDETPARNLMINSADDRFRVLEGRGLTFDLIARKTS